MSIYDGKCDHEACGADAVYHGPRRSECADHLTNPYEAASERFQQASRNYPKAKAEAERILREADDEYDAAEANLRQYESQPGIPLPQYREQVQV